VAAISVGVKDGEVLVDLNYAEDSTCQVDMNIIMTEDGQIVEIQGTGEESPFSKAQLAEMLEAGESGIHELIQVQKECLGEIADKVGGTKVENAGSNK
jgi:ribonuclease PH